MLDAGPIIWRKYVFLRYFAVGVVVTAHFGGTHDDIRAVSVLLQQFELSKVKLILACIPDQ